VDGVIFAADLFTYAFVGVSLSDTTFMGGEYLIETCFFYWYLLHYLPPKKA